jgi:hypothetical protein
MMDTGKCLMKGAGVPEPIDVRPPPLDIATIPVTPAKAHTKVKSKPKRR